MDGKHLRQKIFHSQTVEEAIAVVHEFFGKDCPQSQVAQENSTTSAATHNSAAQASEKAAPKKNTDSHTADERCLSVAGESAELVLNVVGVDEDLDSTGALISNTVDVVGSDTRMGCVTSGVTNAPSAVVSFSNA